MPFLPKPSNFRCRTLVFGLLVVGIFLGPGPAAKALCIKTFKVKGSNLIGGPQTIRAWIRYIHSAQVVAGKDNGPKLPNDACATVRLEGEIAPSPQGWRFIGKFVGKVNRPLMATGARPMDWFTNTHNWVGIIKDKDLIPSDLERRTWVSLANNNESRFLQDRQSLAQAITNGASDAAKLEMALLLQEVNPDFARARKLLEELERTRPYSFGVSLALGQLCLLLTDDGCARRTLERATKLQPKVLDAWGYLFVLYQGSGNLGGQHKALVGATKADGKNAFYLYALAAVLSKMGKGQEAFGPLKAAIKLQSSLKAQAKSDPDFVPLKRFPEFDAIIK